GKKGLLYGVELPVLGEALDGNDGLALGFRQGRDARHDGTVVDEDGAGAALALAATVFGAREVEILAQGFEQRPLRVGLPGPWLAVHRQRYFTFHGPVPFV